MTIRSIVLFTHICGMLLLFMSFSLEWLVLALAERGPEEHVKLTAWRRAVARLAGLGSGVVLLSGIYLARGGYFEFWWVRGSLALLVVMGVLGGIVRSASTQARRTSLLVRIALGLAAVYLMVVRPW